MQYKIRHRYTGVILFACNAQPDMSTDGYRHALELAVKDGVNLSGAYLPCMNLRGAKLNGAKLRTSTFAGADLSHAEFRGADLWGSHFRHATLERTDFTDADLSIADFRGADLSKAILCGTVITWQFASVKQSVANLDQVREIIRGHMERFDMQRWHGSDEWRLRSRADEVRCGTTHCLAGWLQVCSNDPDIRNIRTEVAGAIQAPVAAKMFFRSKNAVLGWLRNREYVVEAETLEMSDAETIVSSIARRA